MTCRKMIKRVCGISTRQCLWRNLSNIASLCLHTKMQLKNKKNSLQNKWYSAIITTKKKLEVNFMDSCDGYGRSRKHGAFSCKHGTAVCGK